MIRVLFVDDDPAVLDNLRHLLHRQEREWDMAFAPDPDAGLAELAREPADVVVSDMGMPGMGGAGFLARVRDLYTRRGAHRPVRRALGDIDRKVLPFAHQYLGKPCRTEQLVDVINRTASLYTHLDDPVMRRIISRLDRLPTVPHVYLEITRLASQAETTLDDLAAGGRTGPGARCQDPADGQLGMVRAPAPPHLGSRGGAVPGHRRAPRPGARRPGVSAR
jgi:DNA-binding NarL/FixJ family response regulator